MYVSVGYEDSSGKREDVYTDERYDGENTRAYVGVNHGESDSTYAAIVCGDPVVSRVMWNQKDYTNGQLTGDTNFYTQVPSTKTEPWGYQEVAYQIGSDRVYDIKTNFPIFDLNPDDPEKVDAIKRYIESGDISGAENYVELMSPVVHVTVKLVGPRAPIAYISTSADFPKGSPLTPGDFKLTWRNSANHGTLPIDGGSESLTYDSQNPAPPILKTAYTLGFFLECTAGDGWQQSGGVSVHRNPADSSIIAETENLDIILIVNGQSTDDDKYQDDDNNTDPNHDPTGPSNVNDGGNISTLSTTYQLTAVQMKSLGNFLWSSNFTDDINLVNESPIQNVVSSMAIPVGTTGTSQEIKIVNVSTGVNATKVAKQVLYLTGVGSTYKDGKWHCINGKYRENCPSPSDFVPYNSAMPLDDNGVPLTWLDYEKTSLSLHLPYIGFKTLNTRQFMGKGLQVDYVVDLITGACEALVHYVVPKTGKKVLVHRFGGTCGINIPLTARDNTQYLATMATSILGSVSSFVGGLIGGNPSGILSGLTGGVSSATQHIHQDSTGTPSPMCSTLIPNNIYLVIERPRASFPKNYGHNHGWNCHFNAIIKNLNGYTKLDRVDLSGLTCTASERAHIKELLEGGFYTGNRS